MSERRLKYRWRRSWEDVPDDYVAMDGNISFGRVHLHQTGPNRFWTWYLWDQSPEGLIEPETGADPDKMAACQQLEAAYDAARGRAARRAK